MTTQKRNELIDRKIERIQSNIDYNTVELEFSEQMERPDEAAKYQSRIDGFEAEIATLQTMKNEPASKDNGE